MTDNWTDTEIERRKIVEAGGTVTAHLNRDTNLIETINHTLSQARHHEDLHWPPSGEPVGQHD